MDSSSNSTKQIVQDLEQNAQRVPRTRESNWRRSMAAKASRMRGGGPGSVKYAAEPMTFYRESTPPGSSGNFGTPAVTNATRPLEEPYDYSYDRVAPPAPIPEATICGLSRRMFWITVAVATFLVLGLTIGVGVGVGVGKHHHKSKTSPENDSNPTAAITTAASTTSPAKSTSTRTSTTSSPTPTPTTDSNNLSCPAANNTIYHVPDSTAKFKRICGIDYSGVDQAKDIATVWTITMQDCIFQCAEYPGCTACGWGVIKGDPGSEHRCWMKANLTSSHVARPGWEFAILTS